MRGNGSRGHRGFSLVELAACLAVIAALAVLLPAAIAHRINNARLARARTETQALANAIERFERDNAHLPACAVATDADRGRPACEVELIVGPGNAPRAPSNPAWVNGSPADILARRLPGYGPVAGPDPWGNRYIVNVGARVGGEAVWVISAGPDGVIETPYRQPPATARLAGDDVGVRIK